jgi:hypothetical protein
LECWFCSSSSLPYLAAEAEDDGVVAAEAWPEGALGEDSPEVEVVVVAVSAVTTEEPREVTPPEPRVKRQGARRSKHAPLHAGVPAIRAPSRRDRVKRTSPRKEGAVVQAAT